MTKQPGETLLTFPCDFTLKVFGLATEAFKTDVFEIIHKHAPSLSQGAMHSQLSKNGKYNALSISVHVDSKEQLDRIYQDLTASSQVLMAL